MSKVASETVLSDRFMTCIENGFEKSEEKDSLLLKERNIKNGKNEISMDKTVYFSGCH